MNEYIYPAVFHLNGNDGSYTITFPDLPSCITEGKDLSNALYMAQDLLTQWAAYCETKGETLPHASHIDDVVCEPGEFVNLVRAVVRDDRAVRRTVSLPKWLDDQVSNAGLSLSRVLQDALKDRLNIS